MNFDEMAVYNLKFRGNPNGWSDELVNHYENDESFQHIWETEYWEKKAKDIALKGGTIRTELNTVETFRQAILVASNASSFRPEFVEANAKKYPGPWWGPNFFPILEEMDRIVSDSFDKSRIIVLGNETHRTRMEFTSNFITTQPNPTVRMRSLDSYAGSLKGKKFYGHMRTWMDDPDLEVVSIFMISAISTYLLHANTFNLWWLGLLLPAYWSMSVMFPEKTKADLVRDAGLAFFGLFGIFHEYLL